MLSYYKLTVKCPKCGKELGDQAKLIDAFPGVKLFIQMSDKSGFIWLSALYGSYRNEATVDVLQDEIALFKCPHCLEDLTSPENCNLCHAPLVDFHLFEGGKVSICSRAGCTKHSIEFEDLATAMNHFYNEFELSKTHPEKKN